MICRATQSNIKLKSVNLRSPMCDHPISPGHRDSGFLRILIDKRSCVPDMTSWRDLTWMVLTCTHVDAHCYS